MKRLFLALSALSLSASLVLGGCTTTGTVSTSPPPPPALTATEYGCTTAASALAVINANFAKLSAGTKAAVAQARAVLDPIGLQTTVPTLATTAKAGFDAALAKLATAQTEATR